MCKRQSETAEIWGIKFFWVSDAQHYRNCDFDFYAKMAFENREQY